MAEATGFFRVIVKTAEATAPIAKMVNSRDWRLTVWVPELIQSTTAKYTKGALRVLLFEALDGFDALDVVKLVEDLLQMFKVCHIHRQDSLKHGIIGIDGHTPDIGLLH